MNNKRFSELATNNSNDRFVISILANKNQVAFWTTESLKNALESIEIYMEINKDKERNVIKITIKNEQ